MHSSPSTQGSLVTIEKDDEHDLDITHRIGIWKSEVIEGELCYVRDNELRNEWTPWADIHCIPPKKKKKRIVLIGESVARGYLFDPSYNPAIALQQIFASSGELEVEVIDLAKVSIEISEISSLTISSAQLKPDCLVVFAGNNWFSSLRKNYSKVYEGAIEEIINNNCSFDEHKNLYVDNKVFSLIREFVEDHMVDMTIDYLDCLSNISKEKNIPVIFIVPEFNLRDWKSTTSEKILFNLPLNQLNEWIETREEASRSLVNKNWEKLKTLSERMIAIDSSHPYSYELLANYYLQNEDFDKAEQNLKLARDTSMFNRSTGQARVYSVIQETLKREAPRRNIEIIDLPEIFKNFSNGEPPGRNLFLDYCHMNEVGIELSMQHTAQKIFQLITGKTYGTEELSPSGPSIESNIRAAAYFSAAVHNAHYGQTKEILDYFCRKSVSYSLEIKDLMLSFIDFSSRKADSIFCKSYESLLDSELILQYQGGRGFSSRRNFKLMDFDLVNSMISALKLIDVDIEKQIENLRVLEHSTRNKRINLLESFYTLSSYDEFALKSVSYFQARDTTSTFLIVSEDNSSVSFNITYRTPKRSSETELILFLVNGVEVKTLPVLESWQSETFIVSSKFFKTGVNEITIKWPFKTAKTAGVQGIEPSQVLEQMVELFGEIHMFSAAAV